jgi:16S rRNA (cytidine1402-2'-O)-methyltransferase
MRELQPPADLLCRRCCLARELTKRHEEVWRGSLGGALAEFAERGPRGEFVLLIEGTDGSAEAGAGGAEEPTTQEAILAALRQAVDAGESPSAAARSVATRLGQSRKLCYALSLKLQQGND